MMMIHELFGNFARYTRKAEESRGKQRKKFEGEIQMHYGPKKKKKDFTVPRAREWANEQTSERRGARKLIEQGGAS